MTREQGGSDRPDCIFESMCACQSTHSSNNMRQLFDDWSSIACQAVSTSLRPSCCDFFPPSQHNIDDMASSSTQWLVYAVASGGCAALNGVFAKLTTTQLTTTWASIISHLFGFSEPSKFIEVLIRGVRWLCMVIDGQRALLTVAQFFFTMNLAFNAVMWGLFTRALTLATSTVRVSVINTSANFILTAVLGAVIFRESLPGKVNNGRKSSHTKCITGLWWLGASLLVAGSVIIGRREEGKDVGAAGAAGSEPAVAAQEGFHDEPDAPLGAAATGSEDHDASHKDSIELERKPKKGVAQGLDRDEL